MFVNQTTNRVELALNESPSEKEGKFFFLFINDLPLVPSMKVPPKRKGNRR